jgi:hypothetical protein
MSDKIFQAQKKFSNAPLARARALACFSFFRQLKITGEKRLGEKTADVALRRHLKSQGAYKF